MTLEGAAIALVLMLAAAAVLVPSVGVVCIVAAAFVNPSLLPTYELGSVDVRLTDLGLLIALLGLAVRHAMQPRRLRTAELRWFFRPMAPFACALALSLLTVGLYYPYRLEAASVSLLRLAVTLLSGLIIHWTVRDARSLRAATLAILCLCAGSVLIAWAEQLSLLSWGSAVGDGLRAGGLLGPNALGMVAGILALAGVAAWSEERARLIAIIAIGIGLIGLALSRSSSSVLALGISGALLVSRLRRENGARTSGLGSAILLVIGVAGAAFAVGSLRGDDVRGLVDLSTGSFAHRLVVGYAGLAIFADNPFIGVGWQGSAAPEIIGSDSVSSALERFVDVPTYYLPRYAATSVHNLYIQILAELGIIGAVCFAYGMIRLAHAADVAVRARRATIQVGTPVLVTTYGLVFLLVWFNTSPLYGGQLETVLASALLGLLASGTLILRREVRTSEAIVEGGASSTGESSGDAPLKVQ